MSAFDPIAVPLAGKGQVHGVINIIWAKAARIAHLADLQRAVEEIVGALRN